MRVNGYEGNREPGEQNLHEESRPCLSLPYGVSFGTLSVTNVVPHLTGPDFFQPTTVRTSFISELISCPA